MADGDLTSFQASISATPLEAVDELIIAGPEPALFTDQPANAAQQPCTLAHLRAFVDNFDLRRFGIDRSDTVCTAIPNGPEAAVCFWAIANQCVFAPLNPNLTLPEIEFELEDLPCHTMIVMDEEGGRSGAPTSASLVAASCASHGVPVLRMVRDPLVVGLFTLVGAPATAPPPFLQPRADELALVLHTSGTTKKPKIVPLTHSNLACGIQFVARTLQRQPGDVCLNVMPLFHIHGLIANVGVSVHARTAVVCSAFQGGQHFVDLLGEHSARVPTPTWYSAVPTMHEAILQEAEARTRPGGGGLRHSLTLMRNCSAALLPPVSKRFHKTFGAALNQPFTVVPTYAMTESFPICSNPPHLTIKLPTVGPAMGPTVKILKAHPVDEEVAPGEEGEVCVAGTCVTAGYLVRAHMSADPNIEAYSLASAPMGRMLRTGDKGYVDADGYLQLVGRFKEIINCGGEKISPLELEDQLLAVPGVETCVCFATPSEVLGEVVGVAVVPKAGEPPPTLDTLRDGLADVGHRWRPQVLVLMEQIPRGPTGKPKRIGLAKQLHIPVLVPPEMETYSVRGKGDDLGRLMRADGSPVFKLPVSIVLDVSADLGPAQQSIHTLAIEQLDGVPTYTMSVRTFPGGSGAVDKDYPMALSQVNEALKAVQKRIAQYGFEWESGFVTNENSKTANYDWSGTLTVQELGSDKPMVKHHWPNNCTVRPPGALLRLLQVLELA